MKIETKVKYDDNHNSKLTDWRMNMKNKFLVLGLVGLLSIGTTTGVLLASNNMTFANATTNLTKSEVVKTETEKSETENPEAVDPAILDVTVTVNEETAKQTALNFVPGGTFVKIELEDENGVIVYGVEINQDSKNLDVKVDANTGLILASDNDQENDQNLEKDNGKDIEKDTENDNDNVQHENENEDADGHED